MRARGPRRGAGRLVPLLPIALAAAAVGAVASAGPAAAAPWGTSGADYTGVLCRVGAASVPMGSWTVNGSITAYSTRDITGSGPAQQPAPVSGASAPMQPGQAGFSAADITAFAYLIAAHGDGSATDRAEVGAEVALAAGSGDLQSRCLGQNGTSAARASSRLAEARRYAGPYRVSVQTPSGVIPGQNATVAATVRSASGVPTPGLSVVFTAGASQPTAVTGADGVARVSVVVPAAPATAVSATVTAPVGLTYVSTTPPSVAAGALDRATGTAVLRPVLHPKPVVSVSGAELLLSAASLRPTAQVTGTFGYSGTGTITLFGPVQPSGAACSSLDSTALARGPAISRDTFSFTGDSRYAGRATPALAPGCYGLRADVTVTNSSPVARAASAVRPLTVSSLKLTAAPANRVAAVGGVSGVVTGADPGRASVTTVIEARGPLPIAAGRCTGDFAKAPVAGTSSPSELRATDGGLRGSTTVPSVRGEGCYALVARSRVTVDGLSADATSPLDATSTVAVLRPSLSIASVSSGTQGTPVPGDVRVSGTYGFAGVVSVGVVAARSLPITGCGDATFVGDSRPDTTAAVRTAGDTTYAFRTPPPRRNACYAVVATLRLSDNSEVTATSGPPSGSSAFLAGVAPAAEGRTIVERTGAGNTTRAVVTLGITALVIVLGCGALFARTFRRERDTGRFDAD